MGWMGLDRMAKKCIAEWLSGQLHDQEARGDAFEDVFIQ